MSSKYNKFERKRPEARYKIHPAWTGIGCLMLLIVPVMSWAAAVEIIKLARSQNWSMINNFPGYLQLPESFYGLPYISTVASYLSSIPDLPALATFFLIVLLVLMGLLSFVYAIIYRIIGPPRYTSEDAPAPRVKTKRYTR